MGADGYADRLFLWLVFLVSSHRDDKLGTACFRPDASRICELLHSHRDRIRPAVVYALFQVRSYAVSRSCHGMGRTAWDVHSAWVHVMPSYFPNQNRKKRPPDNDSEFFEIDKGCSFRGAAFFVAREQKRSVREFWKVSCDSG